MLPKFQIRANFVMSPNKGRRLCAVSKAMLLNSGKFYIEFDQICEC